MNLGRPLPMSFVKIRTACSIKCISWKNFTVSNHYSYSKYFPQFWIFSYHPPPYPKPYYKALHTHNYHTSTTSPTNPFPHVPFTMYPNGQGPMRYVSYVRLDHKCAFLCGLVRIRVLIHTPLNYFYVKSS